MQAPNIRSVIIDPEKEITYVVLAYRELTRVELVQAVAAYNSMKKRKKKLPKGSTVTILSTLA